MSSFCVLWTPRAVRSGSHHFRIGSNTPLRRDMGFWLAFHKRYHDDGKTSVAAQENQRARLKSWGLSAVSWGAVLQIFPNVSSSGEGGVRVVSQSQPSFLKGRGVLHIVSSAGSSPGFGEGVLSGTAGSV